VNKLSIILPSTAIALGSLFLYLGFESGANGYVTLSIDGAFLLLAGLVTLFAPKARTAEVDSLASLSKEVDGVEELIPQILKGEITARFTHDGKIVLKETSKTDTTDINANLKTIELLSPNLRGMLTKDNIRDNMNHQTGEPEYPLTKKYTRHLIDVGALENVRVEVNHSKLKIELTKPVTGNPPLSEYNEPKEAIPIILSYRMLATLISIVSADIHSDTLPINIRRDQDTITISLTKVET